MDRNHIIGMVCGYYLSRFDENAYRRWGLASKREVHRELAKQLGVPVKSIENWRDEFDPVHDNPRKGWHKREMAPSRDRVLEALGDLSESELFAILRKAIEVPEGEIARVLIEDVSETNADVQEKVFTSRGVTGKMAEDLFIEFHGDTGRPIPGQLIDRRYDGCGYDFSITGRGKENAVEVKGLAGLAGGILFTDKEWSIAQEMGGSYYLVVVRNVIIEPTFSAVRDPVVNLKSQLYIYRTLNLNHSVSGQCLSKAEEDITD